MKKSWIEPEVLSINDSRKSLLLNLQINSSEAGTRAPSNERKEKKNNTDSNPIQKNYKNYVI
jgi:hypothetical protein